MVVKYAIYYIEPRRLGYTPYLKIDCPINRFIIIIRLPRLIYNKQRLFFYICEIYLKKIFTVSPYIQ